VIGRVFILLIVWSKIFLMCIWFGSFHSFDCLE
jgi:hypothetical protein